MKCLTNGSYLFFVDYFLFLSVVSICISVCLSVHPSIQKLQFSSIAQSCPTLCNPMNRSTPGLPVHHQLPDSHPLSWWCHPVISSSVVPFSSCPQSLPASESFPMSQLFTWSTLRGGQSIGVSASASVLPLNTQDCSPLGWPGWISKSLEKHTYKCWIFVLQQLFLITASYIWITEIKHIIFLSVRKIQYMLLKA